MRYGDPRVEGNRTQELLTACSALDRRREESLSQVLDLGRIEHHDVRRVRVVRHVVLMVALGGEELVELSHFRHDRTREILCLGQLIDVRGRFLFLSVVAIEDRRAILRADVRPLAIELRRIVRDGEEHLEQFAVRHDRRIVHDANRLGVAGLAGADVFI